MTGELTLAEYMINVWRMSDPWFMAWFLGCVLVADVSWGEAAAIAVVVIGFVTPGLDYPVFVAAVVSVIFGFAKKLTRQPTWRGEED